MRLLQGVCVGEGYAPSCTKHRNFNLIFIQRVLKMAFLLPTMYLLITPAICMHRYRVSAGWSASIVDICACNTVPRIAI